MKPDKTDELIAGAIAALPYRRPSAGFSARVMAGLAAGETQPWYAGILKAAGLTLTAWVSALAFVSARAAYANLGELAALAIQPGGFSLALTFMAARAALLLSKLAAAASFASEMLSAASAWLPAWYEIGFAVLFCSAAIAALSKSARLARQEL